MSSHQRPRSNLRHSVVGCALAAPSVGWGQCLCRFLLEQSAELLVYPIELLLSPGALGLGLQDRSLGSGVLYPSLHGGLTAIARRIIGIGALQRAERLRQGISVHHVMAHMETHEGSRPVDTPC